MYRLFVVLTLAPIGVWLLTVVGVIILGAGFNCTIHEGFANPCMVLGRDIGETAYGLGVFAAWGPLFVLPISLGMAILWGAFTLVARLWARNR
ncbi:hypothetical protein [Tritonibacter litoralis]|uniref:hypothetical protein n=1 Tax=Tritonibacter litoralis TaxID=2662264 RepID=UPI001FEB6A8E|nr:hypothetical protein [Tritonibacter litoralis]